MTPGEGQIWWGDTKQVPGAEFHCPPPGVRTGACRLRPHSSPACPSPLAVLGKGLHSALPAPHLLTHFSVTLGGRPAASLEGREDVPGAPSPPSQGGGAKTTSASAVLQGGQAAGRRSATACPEPPTCTRGTRGPAAWREPPQAPPGGGQVQEALLPGQEGLCPLQPRSPGRRGRRPLTGKRQRHKLDSLLTFTEGRLLAAASREALGA